MSANKNELHQGAIKAREAAYSPYSKCKIGATVALSNGKIYSGANIENASYGGTVCAERVAIWKALSENPGTKVVEVCVVSDAEQAWPPCGMCRQVMAEFADSNCLVHVGNLKALAKTYKLSELLPEAFTPSYLTK